MWDELFSQGQDLNVGPGSPNGIERIEAGLLSYGTDMDEHDNPLECGLGVFLDLDADIESLSLPILKATADKQSRQSIGIIFDQQVDLSPAANAIGGFDVFDGDQIVGEIRSQVWSFRYKKHLAMAIVDKAFLQDRSSIVIAGQTGQLHNLPFSQHALEN